MSVFLSFLWIGIIGFGGGNALVPVIENVIVNKKKLITDESYHDKVFIANITPGALPVEIACGVGKEISGRLGMVLEPIAMALPGAFLCVLLLACFSELDGTVKAWVQVASVFVSIYIFYQLIKYIVSMFRESKSDGKLKENTMIFLVTVVLVCGQEFCELIGLENAYAPGVSTTVIMLCVLAYAFFTKRIQGQMKLDMRGLLRDEGLWLCVFLAASIPAFILYRRTADLLVRGAISAVVSFGGGTAYLSIADDLFVQSGMISMNAFYGELITVVNILPGSILVKTLTGVGYIIGAAATGSKLGGCVVAFAGFMCAICFSCLTYLLIENMYRANRKLAVFKFIKSVVKPIVSAFMVSVMLTLLRQDMSVIGTYIL